MEKIENMECAMLGGGMSHCSIEFPLSMYVHEYVPSLGELFLRWHTIMEKEICTSM